MVLYEQIYRKLLELYDEDDVYAFFNEHERRVRHRVVAEVLKPTPDTVDIRPKTAEEKARS